VFLFPIGQLGGHVTAKRFHAVPRRANGNWGSLFHFPPASYIIRISSQLIIRLAPAFTLLPCSPYSTLKMEAVFSSETSVDFQQTRRPYIIENSTLHNHRCEDLKSYFLTLIQRVLILNFGGDTSYFDDFNGSPQSLQANSGLVLGYNRFPLHFFFHVLPCHLMFTVCNTVKGKVVPVLN
jgi:hypothetical protein